MFLHKKSKIFEGTHKQKSKIENQKIRKIAEIIHGGSYILTKNNCDYVK